MSFGYVLPVSDRYALVEYTEFGPDLLTDAGYDAALAGYRDLLGLDPTRLTVREVENGVIPMTDAPFEARPSPRVVRLGTAGGAARPHRVHLLRHAPPGRAGRPRARGRPPAGAVPASPRGTAGWTRSRSGRWTAGGVGGPDFFGRLFDRNPPSGCCGSSTARPPRRRRWR